MAQANLGARGRYRHPLASQVLSDEHRGSPASADACPAFVSRKASKPGLFNFMVVRGLAGIHAGDYIIKRGRQERPKKTFSRNVIIRINAQVCAVESPELKKILI